MPELSGRLGNVRREEQYRSVKGWGFRQNRRRWADFGLSAGGTPVTASRSLLASFRFQKALEVEAVGQQNGKQGKNPNARPDPLSFHRQKFSFFHKRFLHYLDIPAR